MAGGWRSTGGLPRRGWRGRAQTSPRRAVPRHSHAATLLPLRAVSDSDIQELLSDPRLCILLGAGAGWDSGLPLGDGAAVSIIQRAFAAVAPPAVWQRFEEEAGSGSLGHGSWPRFEVVLSTLARYLPSAPRDLLETFAGLGMSSTHQLLAMRCDAPTLWLTTNFDDLIERSLGPRPFRVVASRREMATLSRKDLEQGHVIVKLHGDRTSVDSNDFGMQIEEILRAFPAAATEAILDLIHDRPLLVVGYAARDPDLLPLWTRAMSTALKVGWVDLGAPKDVVRRLLARSPDATYSERGAPAALLSPHEVAPLAQRAADTWQTRTAEWLRDAPAPRVIEALADLCVERNDPLSRGTIPTLHALGDAPDAMHRVWRLEREAELHLRAADGSAVQVRTCSERLVILASDHNTPPDVRCAALKAAGSIAFRTTDVDQATDRFQRALRLMPAEAPAKERIDALLRLGIAHVYRGESFLRDGIEVLRQALRQARAAREPVLRAEAATRLAVALMRFDRPRDAERLLRATRRVVEEVGSMRRLLVHDVNLAESLRYQRRWDVAAVMNRQIVERATLADDREVIGNAAGNLGLCELYLGHREEAEAAFVASENEARRHGGEMLANARYNRGWLRLLDQRWRDAESFLNDAADRYATLGAGERQGGARALVGWCELRDGRPRDALATLHRIDADDLAPSSGQFAASVHLLRYALTNPPSPTLEWLSAACGAFEAIAEERYHLLDWARSFLSPEAQDEFVRSLHIELEHAASEVGGALLGSAASAQS